MTMTKVQIEALKTEAMIKRVIYEGKQKTLKGLLDYGFEDQEEISALRAEIKEAMRQWLEAEKALKEAKQ